MRLTVAAAVSCVLLTSLCAAQHAAAAIRQETHIPPQNLDSALQTFAQDRNLQLVYATDDVGSLRSSGASGNLSANDALKQLLEGTGLVFEFLDDRTVTVAPAVPASRTSTRSAARMTQQMSSTQSGGADSNQENLKTSELWDRFRLAQVDQGASTSGGGSVASTARGGEPATLEEIIVTANKVAEPLNKVPASVGVLTSWALESQHVVDMQDVVNRVPGLSSNFGGRPGTSQFTIRGISPGGGTETTTGLYIDDVSINSGIGSYAGAQEPSFFDLDRIEVLRGPQGTLYGADSFGGTIRYVNKQPDLNKVTGQVTTQFYGQTRGDPGESATAAINLPLIDRILAVRLATIYQHDGGFIDHKDEAGAVTRTNANTQQVYGFRSIVLWQPIDTLKVTPTFQYQKTTAGDSWSYDPHLGAFNTPRVIDEPVHDRLMFGALNISADFGSSTLTSVSSYVDRKLHLVLDYTRYDNSGYVGPIVASALDPGDARNSLEQLTSIATPAFPTETNKRWAQEIRLASHFDSLGLRTLLGLYFDHEVRGHQSHETAAGFGGVTQALFGLDTNQALTQVFNLKPGAADLGDTFFALDTQERVRREAAFAEISWTPSDERFRRLTLTAGSRFSRIRYDQSGFYDGFFAGGYGQIGHKFKENQVAPKYSIAYQATDTALLYASAAKGFRLGGTNQPLPQTTVCEQESAASGIVFKDTFSTDSIWSYEAGTKLSLLNRTVQLNASAFHINWNNIAEQVAIPPPCGFPFQANVGTATSNGGDISLELHPMTGLDVQLGVAYTDAHFTKTIANDHVDEGAPVPFSPSWTGNLNLGYTWPILAGNGYVLASYNYTDTSHGALTDTQGNFIRPSYNTVGASGGYQLNGWDVSVYGKNLANARPQLVQDLHTGYNNVSTLRPRQFGVELKYAF